MRHTAEAHFRDIWIVVTKAAGFEELRSRTPQQLIDLATHIHDKYASTRALLKLEEANRAEQDDVLYQSIQFCRDILDYINLDDAIKAGDVGRLENLIPRMFFRFNGGSNSHYAIELMELMQGLKHEWPDDLKYVPIALSQDTYLNLTTITQELYPSLLLASKHVWTRGTFSPIRHGSRTQYKRHKG